MAPRTTRTRPTAPTNRARTSVAVLATAGLLLAACAPGDEEPEEQVDEDLVEDEADPDDPANDEDWEEEADPDSQAGDDLADADGILLAVEPACAEIGDGFTVTADGLDPDTDHTLMIDPEPSATGAFEAGVLATSDADGTLEASATLGEDMEIQPGDYEIELYTSEEGDAAEWLISADLEIAEECAL